MPFCVSLVFPIAFPPDFGLYDIIFVSLFILSFVDEVSLCGTRISIHPIRRHRHSVHRLFS